MFRSAGQGVQLVLGMGHEIGLAGQHLPETADQAGHMFDTVQDHAVFIAEDDVAVFSHDLYNQCFMPQIPHLVQMLHIYMNNAFQSRLGDGGNAPVLQMLSQQHAEARGRHGAGLVLPGEIYQGQGGVRRQEQTPLAAGGLDGQQQFVTLRLRDFIEPASQAGVVQFFYDSGNGHAVKSHVGVLLL